MEVWSGFFGKQITPWIYCGGGLYLAYINCRWNNWHAPCPLAVALISFMLVAMEIPHELFKDPTGYGYVFGWRVWIPYNKHNMLLVLQVMPSYFSTVTNAESTAFIFYAEFFFEAVTYQHNILMNFCGWGCTSPEYLGSHILQCVNTPPHLISLI